MKVMVIGYGSMGRRRIRILKQIRNDCEFICVDSNEQRMKQAEGDGFSCVLRIEDALREHPDCAFVCTSPGHHKEIIRQLLNNGLHVFTELNLTSDGYEEIIKKATDTDRVVFMSSTRLYHKCVEAIRDEVRKTQKPLTYMYHVGQYLPDWHPWEDYRQFFAGKKETNGVREILAIQMPWIIEVFGKVKKVYSVAQRCTDLEIDFPDARISVLEHENGSKGVFLSDVVSRSAANSLEIIGEDLHIRWNGHLDDLFIRNAASSQMEAVRVYEEEKHADGYSPTVFENQYEDEIRDFLEVLENGKEPRYSLEKDRYTLSIIDRMEGNGYDK